MATYTFAAYRVSTDYIDYGSDSTIQDVVEITITDNDALLHDDEASDPGAAQQISIDGVAVDSYQFYYDDSITVDGTPETVKTFLVSIGGTNYCFLINDDGPTIPGAAVGQTVSLVSYGTYTNVTYSSVACFAEGTRIRTERGEAPIETLAVGDMVWTLDHGFQPIRWIGASPLSVRDLLSRPHLRPIRIPADTFGPGMPKQDLRVSPQHRVLLRGWQIELHFGEKEVLAPAKGLVGENGITTDQDCRSVTYYHMMFDSHEIVRSDGLLTESFLLGETIRGSMDLAQRDELLELFPELRDLEGINAGAARPVLRVKEAQVLASLAA